MATQSSRAAKKEKDAAAATKAAAAKTATKKSPPAKKATPPAKTAAIPTSVNVDNATAKKVLEQSRPVTAQVQATGQDMDITRWIESASGVKNIGAQVAEFFKNIPSGGYNPTYLDPNAIAGLYNQNPLVSTAELQQRLAAERASALESQLAALDTRYQSSIGDLESAYGAVNQLLGTAQQDFTKGYNPIIASQGGVNAETAAAMNQAQQEVAARLASTGSTSVGGGQSAAVGSQVAAEAAATGAAQADLLIGQGGAMQAYMTGMAPQLASLARMGALRGIDAARANSAAQLRAQAAQAQLEDMRALALQDIQARNARSDSMIGAVGNVMGTNVAIANSASAANAQAASQLALSKAKMAAELAAQEQKGMLTPAQKVQADKLEADTRQFIAASGGRDASYVFNRDASGKLLPPDKQLLNADGTLNMENFANWSNATNKDLSYVMTYLHARRAMGVANDSDFEYAIRSAAKARAIGDGGGDQKRTDTLFDKYRIEMTRTFGGYGRTPDNPNANSIFDAYGAETLKSAFQMPIPEAAAAPATRGVSPTSGQALSFGVRYPSFAPLAGAYAAWNAARNAGRGLF